MKLHSFIRHAALLGLLSISLGACNKSAPTEGGAASPSSGEKTKKIAFVTNGVASFWTIAAAGVKAAAQEFKIDAQTLMPAEGISDQKRMIEDLLTRGIDGIALSPIDPTNQTELINIAAKKPRSSLTIRTPHKASGSSTSGWTTIRQDGCAARWFVKRCRRAERS